jgi:hypothetical protein
MEYANMLVEDSDTGLERRTHLAGGDADLLRLRAPL